VAVRLGSPYVILRFSTGLSTGGNWTVLRLEVTAVDVRLPTSRLASGANAYEPRARVPTDSQRPVDKNPVGVRLRWAASL